jgi:hypothetical protein
LCTKEKEGKKKNFLSAKQSFAHGVMIACFPPKKFFTDTSCPLSQRLRHRNVPPGA